jgi:alpha-N-arabinofuranosidase
LIVGGTLITLINNADRVKAACLAQLVNVIGPIMTETGGPAWRQTIFHPFSQAARYARGAVLRAQITAPTFATKSHGNVPSLLASVTHDPESGAVTVLALNRHASEEAGIDVELRGLGSGRKITLATELHHADLKASNSKAAPENIKPAPLGGIDIRGETLHATLKPLSWNVIVTAP